MERPYELFRFVLLEEAAQMCTDKPVGQAQLLPCAIPQLRIRMKKIRIDAAGNDGEF